MLNRPLTVDFSEGFIFHFSLFHTLVLIQITLNNYILRGMEIKVRRIHIKIQSIEMKIQLIKIQNIEIKI